MFVIFEVVKCVEVLIFVDIYKLEVVKYVLEVGVYIINDIWGVKVDFKMV